jgi:DNA repair protein RadD
MYQFLDPIPISSLELICRRIIPKELRFLRGFDEDELRDRIYLAINTLYGYEVLSKDLQIDNSHGQFCYNLRLELLNTVDDENTIRNAFGVAESEFHKDLADIKHDIAASPWAKLRKEFANLFDIPSVFVIPPSLPKQVTRQLVSPIYKAPPLHEYQHEVVLKVQESIKNLQENSNLIFLPTGTGKTRIALEVIKELLLNDEDYQSQSIVWVTHSTELRAQVLDNFRDLWLTEGNKDATLLNITKVKDWPDTDHRLENSFIVVTPDILLKIHKAEKLGLNGEFGLAVIDECHKGGDSYFDVYQALKHHSKHLIGMTATPFKSDLEKQASLKDLFGGESAIIEYEPESEEKTRFYVSNNIHPKLNFYPLIVDLGRPIQFGSRQMLQELSDHENRNQKIVEKIDELVTKDERKVLLFACGINHMEKLALLLAMRGIRAAYIDYRTPGFRRREIVKGFRNNEIEVLINFSLVTTGFDEPSIDTIFITRPTSSIVLYNQMIGRGLRGTLQGGTSELDIYEVQDAERPIDYEEISQKIRRLWCD